MPLNQRQEALCEGHGFDFSDLSAVLFNCTLKRSPERSHTDALLDVPREIMRRNGVTVSDVRVADRAIAPGVYPDMTEHGYDRDEWPEVWEVVKRAEILVLGTPIWLGEESSACRVIIERLYGMSGFTNDRNQSFFYGKTGGCVVTGNEDGVKHVAMSCLYALQHIGCTIPPQADCGWIGEAGPGPSYGDEVDGVPAGYDNDFTQRNATFMSWNLMHMARMLKDAGGLPSHGNDREAWQAGCRFDYPNPDYRA